MKKFSQSLENFGKALERLKEALDDKPHSSVVIDGIIQRFEFSIELAWKTLKHGLEESGILSDTPKESLKKAFSSNWINDERIWLQMLKDRNETSHTYNEDLAIKVYKNIDSYYIEMKKLYEFLKSKATE